MRSKSHTYARLLTVANVLLWLLSCRQPAHDKLRFTHVWDSMAGSQGALSVDWVHNRLRALEELHPELGVELEQSKWDAIDTKVMTDYRAGIAHDVVITSPQLLAKHLLVGDLEDLTPYMHWDEEKLREYSWSYAWHDIVLENKRLGLPLGWHSRLCIYNKEMFRQAGLDPERPPQTLDELVAYAKKLTRDIDGDGKTDVWGLAIYIGPSRATLEITFSPLIWHFGGNLWDENSKQAVFASQAGVQAAEFLRDLITKHKVTPRWVLSGTTDDTILRTFLNEKIAMGWGWGSYWTQPLEQAGWLSGCYPPTTDCQMNRAGFFVTPTSSQAQFTNTWTVSMHSLTKWPEISYQLIELLIDPLSLSMSPDAGLPAQLSMWQKPEYQTPYYKIWFEATKKGRGMPPTGHFEELVNTISAALQEIMVNDAPVAPTLLRFQEEYNKRYAGE
jgi:ABC-type glycerol-3-phosphate transport system substrate-binding protein